MQEDFICTSTDISFFAVEVSCLTKDKIGRVVFQELSKDELNPYLEQHALERAQEEKEKEGK